MSTHSNLEPVGFADAGGRALFLVAVDTPEQISDVIVNKGRCFSGYFVALLAWDAQACPTAAIARLASLLLDSGCVYFCCWGPGCERVHDVIDQEYSREGISVNDDESTIMTTWHEEESLEEATWFIVNCAFPDDRFFEDCKSVVAFSIGSDSWAEKLSSALANPRALIPREVGGSGGAAQQAHPRL